VREREGEKDDCCIDTEISVISSDIFYWICVFPSAHSAL